MGYSEICCTLCGVSFNLCRVRTPNEPREYAWNYYGSDKPGSTFTCIDDFLGLDDECAPANRDYPGQDGCMIEFREDEALQARGLRGLRVLGRGGDEEKEKWEGEVFGGLEGERVDLEEEEERDGDWVPGRTPGTGDGDSEMEYYEFDSGTEHDEEDTSMGDQEGHELEDGTDTQGYEEDVRTEDSEDESGTDDQSEYRHWAQKVLLSGRLKAYGYDLESTDSDKIKRAEKMRCLADEFRVKFPTVVRYPLYVPLESLDMQLRSEIEQGQHEDYTKAQEDGKKIVSLTLNHYSNVLWPLEGCWEHLAGPDCGSTKGYHGSRISREEMLHCNIAQAILGTDLNQSWEPESTDEDWEGQRKPGWYLTGLVDSMKSRDWGGEEVYPNRHPNRIQSHFQIDNIHWDHRTPMAMPFHPTCLEVFKRVSLKRRGCFDINALGNWWRSSANYGYMDQMPRAREVRGGRGQWWYHAPGAEYLAANPCFVPSLKSILVSSRRVEFESAGARAHTSEFKNVLSSLPVEIQRSMMYCLDPVDIASLSVAYPNLRAVAQGVLQSTLLRDIPYLWELWCDKPYSQWTKTSVAEIRAGRKAFEEQEQEIARILEVLEEEGFRDQHAMYKQQWDETREERRRISRVSLQEKPSDFVGTQNLDLVELVLRLNKARTNGELKGFRNRERIWTDCNYILDQIEELQEEGTIPPSS